MSWNNQTTDSPVMSERACSRSHDVLSIHSGCRINSMWQRLHMFRNKGGEIDGQNLYKYEKVKQRHVQLSPAQVDLTVARCS